MYPAMQKVLVTRPIYETLIAMRDHFGREPDELIEAFTTAAIGLSVIHPQEPPNRGWCGHQLIHEEGKVLGTRRIRVATLGELPFALGLRSAGQRAA
ncbi:hypothetical protein [Bremerella sp. P1]|uniref:hypothetical protein n=1 Tax=Bremerella sp. P1 TaxID=3026424 RepID=UPI0023689FDB|nr:hypothetical protein [Bremerella sp. P1]WDI43967.1 hypothetical protein PSR63_08465 [Bremerella sp. P1]